MFPSLSPEEFRAAFPSPGRERAKELNRLYPEGYAPKSWFSAANADKRGLKLQGALDRLKLRGFPDFQERADKMRGALETEIVNADIDAAGYREAVRINRAQARNYTGRTSNAFPRAGDALPTPNVDYGPLVKNAGVRVESTPHYGERAGGCHSTRGRGDLHGGRQVSEPRRGALGLASFALKIEREEKRLAEIRAKGRNDRDLARKIRAMKHDYAQQEHAHKTGGVMERLHSFENSAGRSSRGKAAAEKMKADGEKARH